MLAQYQLLTKVINNKDYSTISMNNLTKEYFYQYPAEFDFIKNHYEYYGVVPDAATFLDRFPDFVNETGHLINVSEPDSYLLEQVVADYTRQYIGNTFNNIKHLIESGKDEEAKNYLMQAPEGLRANAGLTCVDLLTDKGRLDKYLDRLDNPLKARIHTGFPELDEAIGGIDPEEEDMVIAARTGIGKSWTLIIMAIAAAAQGYNVGMYSGEMTTDKVGYRLDTLVGGLNNTALMRGREYNTGGFSDLRRADYEDYFKSIPEKLDQFMYMRYGCPAKKGGSIKVITPNDIPGAPTVDALKGFVEKYKIEILFIDQYSLLEDTSRSTVEHERVANISKAVKRLQVAKRIPIISVSQMNRSKAEDKDGNKVQDTTQIALTDRIGQDATTIIMLDRDLDDAELDSFGNPMQLLKLYIAKARDGGDGKKLTYKADFNIGTFEYVREKPTDKMTAADIKEAEDAEDEYN